MKSILFALGVATCLSIAHAAPAPVALSSPELSTDVQHMQALNRRIAFLERRLRYSFLTDADRSALRLELEQLRQQSLTQAARLRKAGVDPNLWALRPDGRPLTVASLAVSDTPIVIPPGPNQPPFSNNLSQERDNVSPKPNKSDQAGQKGGEKATDRPGRTGSSGAGLPPIARDQIDKGASKAAEKADKDTAKAVQKADNAAEKADRDATKAVQKADKAAEKADRDATKAVQKADKAAEKADRDATKAVQKADKAEQNAVKAVEKADRAAEKVDRKATDKADKKAEKNDPADKHADKGSKLKDR